jgi:ammonium transporter
MAYLGLCPGSSGGLGDRRNVSKNGRPRFCGRNVVHIDSGVAGLAGALVLGKRKDI